MGKKKKEKENEIVSNYFSYRDDEKLGITS